MSRRKKQGSALPAGASGARPMVAIVGRPNVGKSTLFNKLARRKIAIVEDVPGVTRDRHYADCWALGREYVLIDTGGFDPDGDDPMKSGIASQVRLALDECDAVLCVVDATTEPTPADREAVRLLRQSGKPVRFLANKADSESKGHLATTYYELGIEELLPVSALHSRGFGKLEDEIAAMLPPVVAAPPVDLSVPRVAIVGRPNAGKSSMVNRLVDQARQLVDDRPGTTVDSIDTLLERGEHRMILIDTAGIRKQRKVRKGTHVEALSVYQALRAMERSHVVMLMIDANAGVAEQDAKIAGLAEERGCGLVIVLNKGDLLDQETRKKVMDRTREILAFAPWAPMVVTSAKTGKGVAKLLDRVGDAVVEHDRRVTTGELNRFFEEVLETHPPPTYKNRPVRFNYITQAGVRPPTFVITTNFPDGVHFSYERYVVNQIRKRFGFQGTPIRVRYRAKKKGR